MPAKLDEKITVHETSEAAAARSIPRALTIGNFDGCHLGHQSLIRNARALADKYGYVPASLTFSPRPDIFFHPERADQGSLFTPEMKTRAFFENGVMVHYEQDFDAAVACMEPQAFVTDVLTEQLHAKAVVVGGNFRYGKSRAGDAASLVAAGKNCGFEVIVNPFALSENAIVSSTRIRTALRSGNAADAAKLLGRPYLLEGILERGDQLGRTIGFPTLNLTYGDQLVPAHGIYSGYVWVEEVCSGNNAPVTHLPKDALPTAMSVGTRPTVNGQELRIEAHILTPFPQNNFYGRKAGFYFVDWIRNEEHLPSLEALKERIKHDIDVAKEQLRTSVFQP